MVIRGLLLLTMMKHCSLHTILKSFGSFFYWHKKTLWVYYVIYIPILYERATQEEIPTYHTMKSSWIWTIIIYWGYGVWWLYENQQHINMRTSDSIHKRKDEVFWQGYSKDWFVEVFRDILRHRSQMILLEVMRQVMNTKVYPE